MSHFRNLFHKTSGHEQVLHTNVTAPPPPLDQSASSGAAPAATAEAPLEFPVEEAQIRPENRLIFFADPLNPAADRFRLLRMRLKALWKTGKLKRLLITSPLPGDGKSTMLLNLATALAERGKRRVLVFEADLHHASIASTLKLKQWAGITECLTEEIASPFAAIRRIDPLGFYLLPTGRLRRNPTELLQTPAFGHLLEQLTPHFDWLLIDSPPVMPLTDSISIQQYADASLLVVRAHRTPREAVERSIESLGKKNILGIVLNGVEARDPIYYQYQDTHQRDED